MDNEEIELSKGTQLLISCVLIICIIIFAPIFTVWSIRVLMQPDLKLNFDAWCAGLWILLAFHGFRLVFKK